MSSSTQKSPQEAEVAFLESVRPRYEADGFTFTISPQRSDLPDFLGTYVPDAIARKGGISIAIEVKRNQTPAADMSLRKIRRLFDGHDDWRFNVMFMGNEALLSGAIPPMQPAEIRRRMNELKALADRQAAFVLAWSLLEAVLNSQSKEEAGRPRAAGTVIQSLAMNGLIEPETERRLRGLVDLRNRIVHGDLGAEPTPSEVQSVLSAIDETLKAEAH
ncbi:MAG: DUF86 domain-containing protein [Alphaproteobacteria bacterium]|nr:DUF86 domain-containing protein [Alphaproteobacteria bacterium]MCW5739914.1 DUF86 domain-containing protein [Alphaproteobacteria bacterium]